MRLHEQEALFKVHARVHEEAEGHPGAGTGVTRMLVCHTQAGSLIGKCVPCPAAPCSVQTKSLSVHIYTLSRPDP